MAQQIVDDGNGHNVPLRSYVERIFDEREKALALAFDAQQRLREVRSRARGAEAVPRTGPSGSAPYSHSSPVPPARCSAWLSSGRSAAERHDSGTALKREAVAADASYAPG